MKMKKKKLMNLNLKVINYSPEMMDRIYRNTSDLSKFALNQNIIIDNSSTTELQRNKSVPVVKRN